MNKKLFASETNTFHISYVEGKNDFAPYMIMITYDDSNPQYSCSSISILDTYRYYLFLHSIPLSLS
jgi:hypothetical protein